jgi:trans-2,3-dihydro-3-hydroxyanthranilate isomerase
MRRRFATVDVFTATPFTGNPLAVVLDAEGLSPAQMQAVAREFNYSETTFVLPPADPANTARVRIFTPDRELPFAGHPNVGTGFVLARLCVVGGEVARFEEGAGLVPVSIQREGGVVTGAELTAPAPFRRGISIDSALVAAAVSLPLEDICIDRHQPVVASVGLPFLIAELRGREALRRIQPNQAGLAEALRQAGVTGLHLYTRDAHGDAADLSTRMVCRIPMIVEDPATGSANCALAGLLADLDSRGEANIALTIAQGVDMGRPSLLRASVRKQAGSVDQVRIGGDCVEIMEGTLRLAG